MDAATSEYGPNTLVFPTQGLYNSRTPYRLRFIKHKLNGMLWENGPGCLIFNTSSFSFISLAKISAIGHHIPLD